MIITLVNELSLLIHHDVGGSLPGLGSFNFF